MFLMCECELIVAIVGQERGDNITSDLLFAGGFQVGATVFYRYNLAIYISQPSLSDLCTHQTSEPPFKRQTDRSFCDVFKANANMRHR